MTADKRIWKIGVLGCGRVSARYREVLGRELAGRLQVIAAADLDIAKAEAFAAVVGGKPVGGIDELIAERPELVCVLTESGHHAEHALRLIRAGIHVLVGKPVAPASRGRGHDARCCRRRGRYVRGREAESLQSGDAVPAADGRRGQVGRLVTAGIRVHWCRKQDYYDDPWHGRWAMDGGVLAQQAIHHLDALQWLGGPIEAVCAAGEAILNSAGGRGYGGRCGPVQIGRAGHHRGHHLGPRRRFRGLDPLGRRSRHGEDRGTSPQSA